MDTNLKSQDGTLEHIITAYRQSFPEKQRVLQTQLEAIEHSPKDVESALQALYTLSHRLCGSAPMYGFDDLYHAARALETLTHPTQQHTTSEDLTLVRQSTKQLIDIFAKYIDA